MKKSFISFFSILSILFFVLSSFDFQGNYIAEKILWKANKELKGVIRNKESAPDKAYTKITDQLERVIRDYPKAQIVPTVHIFLGQVYEIKGDFETARKKFNEVISLYPKNDDICAAATSALAASYEAQGNWNSALKIYEALKVKYPLTELGLNVPVYIANYYQKNGYTVNAKEEIGRAIEYYRSLTPEKTSPEIAFKAQNLLAYCYLSQGEWIEAINVLGGMLIKFTNPEASEPIIKTINTIVMTQKIGYDVAIVAYQHFIEKNPNHPLNSSLGKMINTIKIMKQKNQDKA